VETVRLENMIGEILGNVVILSLALLSVAWLGRRTGTVAPSLTAFALGVAVNFGIHITWGLFDDQELYFSLATKFVEDVLSDAPWPGVALDVDKSSYVYVLGLLFLVFGNHVTVGLSLNVALMTLLPPILVRTGKNFGLGQSSSALAWLAAVSPPIFLWSFGLKREALVFFLMALLLLGMSKIFADRGIAGVLISIPAIISLSFTRQELAIVGLVGVVVSFALSTANFPRLRNGLESALRGMRRIARILFSAVVALLLGALIYLVARYVLSFNFSGIIAELSQGGQETAVPLASWEFNSSPWGLPYNWLRTIIGPMLWEVSNPSLLVLFFEGVVYGLFAFLVARSFWSFPAHRRAFSVLVLTATPLFLAISLVLANYGLTSRLKAHVFLLLLPLVAPYIFRTWNSLSSKISEEKVEKRPFQPSPKTESLGS